MLIQSKSKGMSGALAVITLLWVMDFLPPLPALLVPLFDTMGCMLSSCVLSTHTFSIHARIQDESVHSWIAGRAGAYLHGPPQHLFVNARARVSGCSTASEIALMH